MKVALGAWCYELVTAALRREYVRGANRKGLSNDEPNGGLDMQYLERKPPTLRPEREDDDVTTRRLEMRGEIDLATAPSLETRLRRARHAGASAIVLDLTHVTFIDARGLAVIALAFQLYGQHRVRLVGVSPAVYHLMHLTKLGTPMPLEIAS